MFNCIEISNKLAKSFLDPEDKQNVPYATEFLLRVYNFAAYHSSPSFRLTQVTAELTLLGYVYNAILSHFVFADKHISVILVDISVGVHILLILYRSTGASIIPGQLYNDFVETCRDLFITCMKYKEVCPDEPRHLILLGTDCLGNWFKLTRATHNSNMMDCLEMINRSQWLYVVDD